MTKRRRPKRLLHRGYRGTSPPIDVDYTHEDSSIQSRGNSSPQATEVLASARQPVTDFDQGLLERAIFQWRNGDWTNLIKIDAQELKNHPDRAKLALVVATAWQHSNEPACVRLFVKLAIGWGCDRRLLAQLLIASTHATLGRAAQICGNETLARRHFALSVKGGGGNELAEGERRADLEIARLNDEIPSRNQSARSSSKNAQMVPSDVAPSQNGDDGVPPSDIKLGIISYAQNFEDVMLWRALGDLEHGYYLDIGAQHPTIDSVSRAFYDQGWHGVHVEPVAEYAEALRRERPGDIVVEAAVSDYRGLMKLFEVPGGGLSTGDTEVARQHSIRGLPIREVFTQCITLKDVFAQIGDREIHWMKVDAEGMELSILNGWGDSPARPWIVLVESTLPLTKIEAHAIWEHQLLSRGYDFVYFDGLNRFYIDQKHADLAAHFACGPNVFDGFTLSGMATSPFVHR